MKIKNKLSLLITLAIFVSEPRYAKAAQIGEIDFGNWQVNAGDASIFNNFSSSDVYGYNTHSAFSASLGYQPQSMKRLRLSTEVSVYQDSISDSSAFGATTVNKANFMANAFYNFASIVGMKPYIGVGLGLSYFGVKGQEGLGTDDSNITPAYQVMTGFSYEIENHPSASLHFGYRYFQALQGSSSSHYNNIDSSLVNNAVSHSIEGRIKFEF